MDTAEVAVLGSDQDMSAGCAHVPVEPAAGCVQVAGVDRPRTIREFERALRGLGFSTREAAAVARDGFKACKAAYSPADELEELRAMVNDLAQQLRKA